MTGILLATAMAASFPSHAADAPVHKFHVAYGRMAVEGRVVALELRFFKHDLEAALERHGRVPGFRLSAGRSADSLFLDYLASTFTVVLNHTQAKASLTGSGEESIGQEDMWWYAVQYEAAEPVTALEVTSRLLFELFDDQRNILKIQHFPSEKRATFYFVPDSDHHETEFSV